MRSLIAPLVIIACGTVVIAASLGIGAQTTPKSVRVIYTTDTLGYIAPCG